MTLAEMCRARSELPCLSVLQPYCDAILIGAKSPENRTWPTRVRGPVLLHAGRDYVGTPGEDDDSITLACADVGSPPVDFHQAALRRGAILGIAELIDCCRPDGIPQPQRDAWANGPWCFRFARPQIFREPIAYRGERGFFSVPAEIWREVIERSGCVYEFENLPAAPPLPAPAASRKAPPKQPRSDVLEGQLALW